MYITILPLEHDGRTAVSKPRDTHSCLKDPELTLGVSPSAASSSPVIIYR